MFNAAFCCFGVTRLLWETVVGSRHVQLLQLDELLHNMPVSPNAYSPHFKSCAGRAVLFSGPAVVPQAATKFTKLQRTVEANPAMCQNRFWSALALVEVACSASCSRHASVWQVTFTLT